MITSRASPIIAFTAPTPKTTFPSLCARSTSAGGAVTETFAVPGLKSEQVHGYALDPDGERLAVSINSATQTRLFFDAAKIKPTGEVRLE